MIKVEVPWKEQRNGAQVSLELSYWCQDRELIEGIDFWWNFVPAEKKTVFYFDDDKETYATLFALTWAGNEI